MNRNTNVDGLQVSPAIAKPVLPAVQLKKRCYNCQHAGQTFKLGNVTHQHCEHPKYTKEQFESGELSAWDTVMKFSDTCNDHDLRKHGR